MGSRVLGRGFWAAALAAAVLSSAVGAYAQTGQSSGKRQFPDKEDGSGQSDASIARESNAGQKTGQKPVGVGLTKNELKIGEDVFAISGADQAEFIYGLASQGKYVPKSEVGQEFVDGLTEFLGQHGIVLKKVIKGYLIVAPDRLRAELKKLKKP